MGAPKQTLFGFKNNENYCCEVHHLIAQNVLASVTKKLCVTK